jgi:uncharacterized protein (TIGR02145 family)
MTTAKLALRVLFTFFLFTSCQRTIDEPATTNADEFANAKKIKIKNIGVKDIDGNKYKTVAIGTQVWMAENLKVEHYRNGDPVPNVTDNTAWSTLTTGAYANYNNDAANGATYGRLYNWYAATDARNIAPAGWHVPSDTEWDVLINYLGGESVAGSKMKETGTAHWASPNIDATNSSGFTSLPGGVRDQNGPFFAIGNLGSWWSSTELLTSNAWSRTLFNSHGVVFKNGDFKQRGFSVRCLRD